MKSLAFAMLLIFAMVTACPAQQSEALFVEGAAYNPLPSPDGRYVAYLLTGRRPFGGSGGLGRSNLRSEIAFVEVGSRTSKVTELDGFLSAWLSDSQTVVSYRDGRFALASPSGVGQQGKMAYQTDTSSPQPAERVAYMESSKQFVWIEHRKNSTLLETPDGPIGSLNGLLALSSVLSISPDGRYLAVGSQGPFLYEDQKLWIYDLKKRTWTDLGPFVIHDANWDYTNPSWNPWFPDSKRLSFFTREALCLSSPDGVERRELLHVVHGGLATVSPGGDSIAYATFTPRPRKRRPDLEFWGGTTLWTVSVTGNAAVAVTKPSENETLVLRWLDAHSLIFDRVGESLFQDDARIWTVSTSRR